MPDPRPERVRMGDLVVRRRDEAPGGLAIRGLGSCVALFLCDRAHGVGGLAHVLLPEPDARSPLTCPGTFAPTAVAALVDQILQRGGRRNALIAKLAGGAHMFGPADGGRPPLGRRNVLAAIEALDHEGIALVAMDVGGSSGRSVVAQIGTGVLRVTGLGRRPKEL